MNFFLDLYRFLYYLVRPNYAVKTPEKEDSEPKFNRFYTFLAAVLFPLKKVVDEYNKTSAKMYALANLDGTLISAQEYLNRYYGEGYDQDWTNVSIYSAYRTVPNLVPQTAKNTVGAVMLPKQTSKTTATKINLRPRGAIFGWATIEVDDRIQEHPELLSDFIADVNSIMMFSLEYEIRYV